jgi:hypothetical protein
MKQERSDHLSCDQRLVKSVEEIIESGSSAVSKPVRAGFTTSCIYACEKRGWKLLILAPTRRILKETIGKASNSAVRIPGNSECSLIEPDVMKNPLLAQLPLTLPDCETCQESEECEVRAILRVDDPRVMALTYPKLEAIMLSRGKTAKEILAKISRADVVMMDEAHFLSLPPAVSVRVFAPLKIPDKYPALERVNQRWLDFCQSNVRAIQEIMERAEKGHAGQHLAKSIFNANPMKWRELRMVWPLLRKLADNHELEDAEILKLRDIITVLSTTSSSIVYISEDDGEGGAAYISAGQSRQYLAINEFLVSCAPSAKHLYVSGTLFEPHDGYFSVISGKEIRNVVFPDFRDATKKLTLIPDRWKLTSRNFNDKLFLIIETIKAIAEREKQPIYLLAPNARKARILKQEIDNLGLKDIFVDYYRSDHNLGVERNERICIALGMAETPTNACDALAQGKDSEERWLDSRKLRQQGVHAATWQAVNRVKDPEGKVDSKVYFIGCRLDQVKQVATWGVNRQLVLREIKETKSSDGKTFRTPIFDTKVDQGIELPKIYSELKNDAHSNRRSVKDYIEEIELYKDNIINSENHAISSIHINRENGAKVEIYNFPQNENELNSTSSGLYSMFVNRSDCYAQQYQNSNSGEWGFSKITSTLTEDKINRHIKGEVTLGTYQIALDDTVTWCMDDIDSHNDETDAREKVGRVVGVMRKYCIPFLLEASGSIDSYHLWVLVSRTSTDNAFWFIRQINSEAKVDCEAWPKQKSISGRDAKYGNLVKLPICLNQRSGGRSAFLDADTFEPLEGPIHHPGLVHLLEIPDLSKSETEGMPRVSIRQYTWSGTRSSQELDYCMKKILENNLPLEGSEGHNLKVAIAVKAQAIGMQADVTAQLFQYQANYDYDISLSKVQKIWSYDYSPWSCSTLRDKCCHLVLRYCSSCPFGQVTKYETKVNA